MSTDIAESLPKRKFAPAPMVAKGAKGKGKSESPAAKGGGGKGASEEGSEKRIRQAVYDIRYRARREDIDLKAAFAQYMSCLLYTSPSPRDLDLSRMPSSA